MFRRVTERLFGPRQSKVAAKNRLQVVLVQDRSGMSTTDMDNFQSDLLEVLSRYFVLETKAVDIEWKRNENSTELVINTPVMGRSNVGKAA